MEVIEGNFEPAIQLFSDEERNLAEQARLAKIYRKEGEEGLRQELERLKGIQMDTASNQQNDPNAPTSDSSTPSPTTK